MTYATAALMVGAALSVLCLWLAVDHYHARQRARSRLARFGSIRDETTIEISTTRTPADLLHQLGSLVARRAPRAHLQKLSTRLIRAGMYGRPGVEEFLGIQLLSVVGGLLLGGAIPLTLGFPVRGGSLGASFANALLGLVLGGALGFFLPSLVLNRIGAQRRKTIDRNLPNVVDMLMVSLEAGIGFDTAVAYLCERGDDPLVVEFRRYLADLRLGRTRRQALEALTDRVQLASLRTFAAAVIQADELGSGLVRTLGAQASVLRAMRRLHAEEKARQAPIKLLFPIVLCILPVLFLVIVAPALLKALTVLGG